MCQCVSAQTRIAVVSDIHVMAPNLLPDDDKKQSAWTTYYAGQRKMLEQSAGLFDKFVTTLTGMAEKPSLLLITGDLTKDGEQLSHNYVKTKLAVLEAAGIQVYVIPGNHDFGDEGNHTQFNADGTTENAAVLSAANFATFYDGYGYGTNSTPDPNGSLSYVTEPADGLVLLAIDSHSASVSTETLNWICNQALTARAAGKRVIAMMHHPLFPHIEGASMFISTYTVGSYESVRNALINAGVNVILTGHFHTSDIAYDWNDNPDNGICDINSGSLISYPCDYRMLTLSADKTTLDVETASLTPDGWTAEECKTWLNDRMKSISVSKMNAKAGMFASFLSTEINNIAEFAADLFILHAEGNENGSPDGDGLGTTYAGYKSNRSYSTILTYGGITDESIYSILYDISHYEDGSLTSGHENRTDDRTLSITLTDPGELVLGDNIDNSTAISCYNNQTADVTLWGRTLYKDGKWNTLCLPFDLTIAGSTLAGADVRELSSASLSDGALTLTFTDEGAVTAIEAGKPYLIKWADGTDLVNPEFQDVTISSSTNNFTSDDDLVQFRGTYGPTDIFSQENNNFYLGAANKLYYPAGEGMEQFYLGACRAYFHVSDPVLVRALKLNFGEEETGIRSVVEEDRSKGAGADAAWYSLDGRKSYRQPNTRGLYIHGGRKIVVH
jgi:3',5'-cyclic AMP phosphodiesterase CpdA